VQHRIHYTQICIPPVLEPLCCECLVNVLTLFLAVVEPHSVSNPRIVYKNSDFDLASASSLYFHATQPHSFVRCSFIYVAAPNKLLVLYVDLSVKLEELMTSSMRETTREAIQMSNIILLVSVFESRCQSWTLRIASCGWTRERLTTKVPCTWSST
jgi:hypothetical protein